MDKHSFKFKNIIYELTDFWGVTDHYQFTTVEEAKDFQIEQFNYLLKVRDFVTMENRINNQIMLGYLKKSSYIK